MTETLVFGALSDDRRRRLLALVAASGHATSTALAAQLGVSRQAVAKHLGILEQANLVSSHKRGRERLYVANTEPLELAARYLMRLGAEWDQRMAALRDLVSDERANAGPDGAS